jgi:hypothetical protein
MCMENGDGDGGTEEVLLYLISPGYINVHGCTVPASVGRFWSVLVGGEFKVGNNYFVQ